MRRKIFIVFLTLLLVFVATLQTFAVDYYYTVPYVTNYNGTDVNYGVNTLEDYYNVRIDASDVYSVDVMSFEILYSQMGGERPQQVNYPVLNNNGVYSWPMPYSASVNNQTTDVVLRFYVSDPNWPFEIRFTATNDLVFSNSGVTPSLSVNNVYYYDFTIQFNSNDLVNVSKGWYIYSDEYVNSYNPNYVPENPSDPEENSSIITVNYLYGGSVISTESYSHVNVNSPFYQSVVAPAGYVVADTNVRNQGIYFPFGISSDVTYNFNVITIYQFGTNQFNAGYDAGEEYGYDDGYDAGRDAGYQDGLRDGREEGGGTVNAPIENPLLWATAPVVAFLNIEFYPGLSIGILFLAGIAISLIIIFLKIFAGG